MQDKKKWFFEQIRTHVSGFANKLQEEIDALQTSVEEHTTGLGVLEKADVAPHIRKQFQNIIDRHTVDRDDRIATLEGARVSFNKILKLEDLEQGLNMVLLDDVIDALSAILQLEYNPAAEGEPGGEEGGSDGEGNLS